MDNISSRKIFKKWYHISQILDIMGRQRSEGGGERAGTTLGAREKHVPSTGVFLGLRLNQVKGEVGGKKLMEAQELGLYSASKQEPLEMSDWRRDLIRSVF